MFQQFIDGCVGQADDIRVGLNNFFEIGCTLRNARLLEYDLR